MVLRIKDVITLANCICGILAIVFTILGPFTPLTTPFGPMLLIMYPIFNQYCEVLVYVNPWGFSIASNLILIAMLLDLTDGYMARKLEQANEFGVRLDNYSDLVSFGIAPSVFIFVYFGLYLNTNFLQICLIMISISFFLSCTVVRLAWYATGPKPEVQGIPSPIPAFLVLVFYWLHIMNLYNSTPGSEIAFMYIILEPFYYCLVQPWIICFMFFIIGFCNISGVIRSGNIRTKRYIYVSFFLTNLLLGITLAFINHGYFLFLTIVLGLDIQMKSFAMVLHFEYFAIFVEICIYLALGFRAYLKKRKIENLIQENP